MDLKLRLLVARIKPLHTLARVYMYNSSIFFYRKKCKELGLKEKIASLKGSKQGKRCFIIGNGPSLTVQDLNKLVNEDCFGSNSIFKIFDQTAWRPKYYLIKDRYLSVTPQDIDGLDVETVFVADYYWRFHNEIQRKDAICLHDRYAFDEKNLKVSTDLTKCFYNGASVSYALMQIAAYMGYTEMYLLGFDHSYCLEIDKRGRVSQTSTARAHFYEEKEMPYAADMEAVELAYKSFKKYAEGHGITVKNATRGGKLELFERVNLDSLLAADGQLRKQVSQNV